MGFMDKITGALGDHKDKAADVVDEHSDKISDGLDKAADVVDEKTGGRFTDQIDTAQDQVTEQLDGLDGQQDDDFTVDTPEDGPGQPA